MKKLMKSLRPKLPEIFYAFYLRTILTHLLYIHYSGSFSHNWTHLLFKLIWYVKIQAINLPKHLKQGSIGRSTLI